MAISRLLPTWFALATILILVAESSAQRPMQIPKDNISSAGKIKAARNGVFHVKNVGGDQWLLMVEPTAEEVVLRGTAAPQWLRAGMAVRFQGNFLKNKSGQPQGEAREPITELKVFTPRADSKIAVKEEAKRGSFLSGGAKSDNGMETAPFSVVGVLVKYKGGHMTVAVGKTQVRAKLADDAKVAVDLADPRFAREGDEIEFEGWHYVGQKDRVHATKVWITIAHTLGEENAKQVAKKPTVEGDVSDEQRIATRKIQIAIARAKREYASGDLREATQVVTSILEQWNAFMRSDESVAARLLQPHHRQLKQVHSFLEMDGVMLPRLPELPELEEVAAP